MASRNAACTGAAAAVAAVAAAAGPVQARLPQEVAPGLEPHSAASLQGEAPEVPSLPVLVRAQERAEVPLLARVPAAQPSRRVAPLAFDLRHRSPTAAR
jgi:hypothetical protein